MLYMFCLVLMAPKLPFLPACLQLTFQPRVNWSNNVYYR